MKDGLLELGYEVKAAQITGPDKADKNGQSFAFLLPHLMTPRAFVRGKAIGPGQCKESLIETVRKLTRKTDEKDLDPSRAQGEDPRSLDTGKPDAENQPNKLGPGHLWLLLRLAVQLGNSCTTFTL
jgi:hypothetical protein